MKKSDSTPGPIDDSGVDMERIKEMMGPLPDEGAPEAPAKKAKKSEHKKQGDESLATAAEEANAAIKAMSPNLGSAKIEKITDEEILDAEGRPIEPIADKAATEVKTDKTDIKPAKAEDPLTAKAVDEIVAAEGDTVLAAEDKKRQADNEVKKPVKKKGFKKWLADLWAKPAGRWGIIGGVIALLLTIGLVPHSRYFILNNVGIRSSLSVKVLDNGTQLPLKNVQVTAAGVTAQTDDEGVAKLEHVKLGATTLVIEKRAFAPIKKPVVLGWGSNPLGEFRVSAVGTQYGFIVTDFLSGKPIEGAQASSGEGNAVSDKDGKILLILDVAGKADGDQLDVHIAAGSYRTDTISVAVGNKEAQAVKMVPARKDVFISNRSGKYDVYTIDVDGKNEKRIVAGTGIERDDIALSQDKNGAFAALVATRENIKNSDGYLMSTLYAVDINTGTLVKIDQSEQIQLIGWSDDGHLGYIKVAAGVSAANPKRQRLMSFNSKTGGNALELAATNYFNDAVMAGNRIYYAPSGDLQEDAKVGLFAVAFDGSGLTTIYDKNIWNIFRTSYDTLTINASGVWRTYKLGTASTEDGSPASTLENRSYVDSNDGKTSLWLDERDGKTMLLSFDKTGVKDTTLLTKAGIKEPLYWITSNTVIFRVSDGKETADYVYNLEGGDAKKIVDVTDVRGGGQWFY